ncbi:hypothetical protein niasHS_014359 [Heterodera schachtii]|uniref:Adenylosuccinate lyase n=1 Tax=Heterodera schachtii TaxID=97005 RepID=A0ABD2I334_HETSC
MCPSNQPDGVFPALFSQQKRATLFRQLWIWLAESQRELGLEEITSEMVAEMKANMNEIRWKDIAEREQKTKHDVMAHIGAFGEVCPSAKGIIHLGVTSCFVQDNADLIIQREALDHVIKSLAICLKGLANFVAENSGLPTAGRAIFHEPSLTTVGRRAANWADGLLDALKNFHRVRAELRFRGVKGAVGTQDALVDLFSTIDSATAKQRATRLDAMVAQKAGFDGKLFNVCGQTYPRYQDSNVVFALSLFGSAAAKFANDFRILQELGEMSETSPDTEDQMARSSATMVLTQQILGDSTKLMSYVLSPLKTFADQGLERTLDDSAIRRIVLSESFLTADAILSKLQRVFTEMFVHKEVVCAKVPAEFRCDVLLTRVMERQTRNFVNKELRLTIEEVLRQND